MTWTYKRGRWTASRDYWLTSREEEAREKSLFWGRIQRWNKFPQLGPVPERWMKYGGKPPFMVAMQELLIGYYSPAIREMVNTPSPLLRFIGKRAS